MDDLPRVEALVRTLAQVGRGARRGGGAGAPCCDSRGSRWRNAEYFVEAQCCAVGTEPERRTYGGWEEGAGRGTIAAVHMEPVGMQLHVRTCASRRD